MSCTERFGQAARARRLRAGRAGQDVWGRAEDTGKM